MGQYTEEYNQIQKWKKERAKYLKDINRISLIPANINVESG